MNNKDKERYKLPEDLYEILFDQYSSLVPFLEHQMNSFHEGKNAYFSARQIILLLTRLRESGLLWRPWFLRKLKEIQQENQKEGLIEKYVRELEDENVELKRKISEQETSDEGP